MKKFLSIAMLFLLITGAGLFAETIAGYFQCVNDDEDAGAYISLGSDGSCILVDPFNGGRMRGTYEINGSPRRGWTGTITFYLDGVTEHVTIGWPMNGNLTIYMGDLRFERR
jgi:hypothetical protein